MPNSFDKINSGLILIWNLYIRYDVLIANKYFCIYSLFYCPRKWCVCVCVNWYIFGNKKKNTYLQYKSNFFFLEKRIYASKFFKLVISQISQSKANSLEAGEPRNFFFSIIFLITFLNLPSKCKLSYSKKYKVLVKYKGSLFSNMTRNIICIHIASTEKHWLELLEFVRSYKIIYIKSIDW